jgi:hypothetical protein
MLMNTTIEIPHKSCCKHIIDKNYLRFKGGSNTSHIQSLPTIDRSNVIEQESQRAAAAAAAAANGGFSRACSWA